MNNESRYTGWFSGSKASYEEYLQGSEFERSVRYGLDEQTRQLIASNEQLSRENYQILGQVNESVRDGLENVSTGIGKVNENISSGFTNLSVALGDLSANMNHLSSVFEWGFSNVLISLGRVNDSLDALIKLAKSPAQTWAYEQFEIARDEFRRGLYQESLESVEKAINGYGSNPGYKTDFRFHFLQGVILLGNFENADLKLIKTAEAQEAFLRAARYAKSSELPLEEAKALLCVGRAAFVQKKTEDALKYSLKALEVDPKLVEAYFQAAQALCVLGKPEEGLAHLVTAIADEHDYSIKAASDGDICQHEKMLQQALKLAKDNYKEKYELDKKEFEKKLTEIKNTEIGGYAVKTLCVKQLEEAVRYKKEFDAEAVQDTIFGYVQASQMAKRGRQKFISSIVDYFELQSNKLIDDEKLKLEQKISSINSVISEVKVDIKNIDNKIDKWISRNGPSEKTITILGILLATLISGMLVINGHSFVAGVIFLFLIAAAGDGNLDFFLAPLALATHKLFWEYSSRSGDLEKKPLQNKIDGKNDNLKKLNEKITELQNSRTRIADFKKNNEIKVDNAIVLVDDNLGEPHFSVFLKSCGNQKINVIKAVREITGLGLKEAKDLVDATEITPQVVRETIAKSEAEKIMNYLEKVGARAEVVVARR